MSVNIGKAQQAQAPFAVGAIVFDIADPDRSGKIVGAGAEVSEVKFGDGADRRRVLLH